MLRFTDGATEIVCGLVVDDGGSCAISLNNVVVGAFMSGTGKLLLCDGISDEEQRRLPGVQFTPNGKIVVEE